MLYRYEAVLDGEAQGLVTLIPFLESLAMSGEDMRKLECADMFVETHLAYPIDENGEDVYVANRGRRLVAYFTEEGNDFFGEAMETLSDLVREYAWDFGYDVEVSILDESELSEGCEVVYADASQVIVAW